MAFLETQAPCLWRACCWLLVGTRRPRALLLPDSRPLVPLAHSQHAEHTGHHQRARCHSKTCPGLLPAEPSAGPETVWLSGSEEVLRNCSGTFTLATAREPELGLTGAHLTCAAPALCSAWAGKPRCRPERTSRGVCTGSCAPRGRCPSGNSMCVAPWPPPPLPDPG